MSYVNALLNYLAPWTKSTCAAHRISATATMAQHWAEDKICDDAGFNILSVSPACGTVDT
jgi:hypothetical protein